ncbi:3-carboxy-cis,cis-muconate cycloisomerase [Rhizobium sp. PP-F2F-G38]|uniref:3-carboxy-cis,cis-muconate cycloisomerase n=1 Tax=Ferranicluibacter rubi TaxID=2715133 RepID=A0AA44CAB0_9HYPH|nr:3-carboxy-cis,cis-muconate cycloisomerase [Ferranicluibacter rubi]PYE32613.1 3-carboxy-cis,cis-muconate cycloisomerase [Rhizobium sp. PP-WC-1G-195]PYE96042.1 3-carboxy-cis,cis-muconate cycloisomerase [Rhizobium sp. PP-F2F-G38]TCP88353.1 3-carboxy-cis,cis-muconate cycloisomerase [Rhizobium sp. PP-CC-2G-626]TCQ22982.1 3-carboxy-cis,cis-muconate cycloisomerase [Rhizobium sp. PP-CC-3G-465]NHT75708.1 3-carboxy-cis,cis-muconate cycloisomerase [Ferranicluibacter rubi]
MSIAAFDHPFLSGLLGDDEVAALLSVDADIRAMLTFEAALARAEGGRGLIPTASAERIAEVCATFAPDIALLKQATATDGVVVPELVRQLRQAVGGAAAAHVHVGATSQDVIDSSLVLCLKTVFSLFAGRIDDLILKLDGLDESFGGQPLMGRTRMQAAIPITVSDRLRSWRAPFVQERERLAHQILPLQFGGAAGTLEKLGAEADAVRTLIAQDLGLADTPQWQSQRGFVADIGHLLSLITGAAGKMGQDIALLAQGGDEIALSGGGASSAMPHKQNPVAAETLVALARFNAVQVSALYQSLVHEQERSGAAWTLEWLILPQMVMATAASLRLSLQMLDTIARLGAKA